MVFGIIALVIAWIPFVGLVGLGLGIAALVIGLRARRRTDTAAGKATAGLVMGSIGIALGVVGIVLSVIVVREVRDFLDPPRHNVTASGCTVTNGLATVNGTLTNESNNTASFTVFVTASVDTSDTRSIRRDSDLVDVIEIDQIRPDEVAPWQASFAVGSGPTDCYAIYDVYGAFPFGVPIDSPN